MPAKKRKQPAISIVSMSRLVRSLVIGFVLLIIGAALVMMIGFNLIKQSQFNHHHQFVFGMINRESNDLILSRLQIDTGELTFIRVPSNLKIELVNGYGSYQIGVVPQLGDQENLGNSLLVHSLNQTFGLPLKGIGEIQSWSDWEEVPVNSLIAQMPLSFKDKLWLRQRLKSAKQVTFVDLAATGTLAQTTRVDGVDENELTPRAIELVSQELRNRELVRQSVEVAIVNATSHSGLASRAAEVMSIAGFDVISVNDQIEKLETSFIQVIPAEAENMQLIDTLTTITDIPVSINGEVESKYRSKVVIVLGEDYWNFLNTKN